MKALVHVREIVEHIHQTESLEEWLRSREREQWRAEDTARVLEHVRKVEATAMEWVERVKEGRI